MRNAGEENANSKETSLLAVVAVSACTKCDTLAMIIKYDSWRCKIAEREGVFVDNTQWIDKNRKSAQHDPVIVGKTLETAPSDENSSGVFKRIPKERSWDIKCNIDTINLKDPILAELERWYIGHDGFPANR